MSNEEVKRLKQYMLMHRFVDAKIAEFLAQRGVGTSTSSAPPVPIPEAVPNPEENNLIYRALAFPVDAPRGCLSLFCMDVPLGLCEGVYVYVHNILCMAMLIVTTPTLSDMKINVIPL